MAARGLPAGVIVIGALLLASCGGGGGGDGTDGSGGIEVSGSSDSDLKIATDLRDYLDRNLRPSHGAAAGIKELCSGAQRGLREAQCEQVEQLAPVYASVRKIDVDDQVITIDTGLQPDASGKEGAAILCEEIQGADVADFTPGHEVLDESSSVLLTCPTRAQLDSPPGAQQ
jgi:hypothetical protein